MIRQQAPTFQQELDRLQGQIDDLYAEIPTLPEDQRPEATEYAQACEVELETFKARGPHPTVTETP